LSHPITLYNIDGTPNFAGQITHSAQLYSTVNKNHPQLLEYLITNLGLEDIILGLPWLRKVNPNIDWKEGHLAILESQKIPQKVVIEEVLEPKESNIGGTTTGIIGHVTEELWCTAGYTYSQQL
ncbi:hypothetical protein GYMLUDRAFT_109093, partial [Collybiopsis luxurians FD-317 M1]